MPKKVKNGINYSKCAFLRFKQKSIENWGKLEGVKVLFLPRNEIHYSWNWFATNIDLTYRRVIYHTIHIRITSVTCLAYSSSVPAVCVKSVIVESLLYCTGKGQHQLKNTPKYTAVRRDFKMSSGIGNFQLWNSLFKQFCTLDGVLLLQKSWILFTKKY